MAIREIRKYDDPALYKVCRPVEKFDERLGELLDDMAETMYQANGVGLAAPQVGILRRVVVIDVGDGIMDGVDDVVDGAEDAVDDVTGNDGGTTNTTNGTTRTE